MEQQLETFVEKLSTLNLQETQTSNKLPSFEESILSTGQEGVVPLAAGLALSGFIGGLFNQFLPLGNLSLPVAGYLMMRFFKSGFLHGMGKGVLAAGIAALFGGLGGLVGGAVGGLTLDAGGAAVIY